MGFNLLKRLLAMSPVMLFVAVFIFLLLGLTKPLFQQFVIWIGNMLQGDLGERFQFKNRSLS